MFANFIPNIGNILIIPYEISIIIHFKCDLRLFPNSFDFWERCIKLECRYSRGEGLTLRVIELRRSQLRKVLVAKWRDRPSRQCSTCGSGKGPPEGAVPFPELWKQVTG